MLNSIGSLAVMVAAVLAVSRSDNLTAGMAGLSVSFALEVEYPVLLN